MAGVYRRGNMWATYDGITDTEYKFSTKEEAQNKYNNEIVPAAKARTSDISNIKSQLLDQWKQLGVPSIGGGLSIEDRAQGLAERLYANQITDLAKLGMGNGTYQQQVQVQGPEMGDGFSYTTETQDVPGSYLTYDGRQIGFLGDIGSAENWQPSGYLQPGNLASWGAQGEGAVSYTVQQAPNGQVYFVPSWGSTSDASTIAPIVGIGLGLLAPGVGTAIGSALGASGAAATVLGNAVIGGAMAEASGGDFLQGALTSGAGAALGAATSPISSAVSEAVGSNALGQALTSGALAEATGGDFLQGAVQGGLSGAISDAKLAAAEDYINSIAPGTSYEADLPTSQDVIDVIAAEQPSYQVSDTTFTPDYSLNIGAPVVQDMGAQGIQVPTINEVIDVVNQPVDYSLPVPSTNVELVMPTTPNIDAMGGGQGITVPVSGGTLTESGVIPEAYIPVLGDVASFINQPAPDSGVTTQEPAQITEDISGRLAALDAAKALAPLAAGALTASAVVNAISDNSEQSGYPILPVPAEWKSPEYSMAFTPSAPIDFGSRALLRGTQWENPVNLSSLINTLNQPIISPQVNAMMTGFQAPEVAYQTGVNDVIGEINGKPISIADIIYGIQSGQNYGS